MLQPPPTDSFYLDHAFKQPAPIESEQDIFKITPAMKDYIATRFRPEEDYETKTRRFINDLLNSKYIGLEYEASANFTASEAFEKRTANCLSLTLLSYVMLSEMGIEATFNKVKLTENWTVERGMVLSNDHVNIKVYEPMTEDELGTPVETITIDFIPVNQLSLVRKKSLSKNDIVALYYNNKGAHALVNGDTNLAYQYFKAATLKGPKRTATWSNLAALYRQSGYIDQAEKIYKHAISLNSNNLTLKENLALLYELSDRPHLADTLMRNVNNARRKNPYFYAMRGKLSYHKGNYERSINEFRKAIELHDKEAEFWFGLARSHYELNQLDQAQRYLVRAKKFAPSDKDENKYQAKLTVLKHEIGEE